MLIHATRRWPTAVDSHLWPYALRYANDMWNNLPNHKATNTTPMEKFANTKVTFNPTHTHTFGCPVYVLDNELQQGHKIDKWSERARVGIFLGYSPQHARSVSLVLSLTSGLTSPQFHAKYDDNFQTLHASFGDIPPDSKWQKVCGFIRDKPKTEPTATLPPKKKDSGPYQVQNADPSTREDPSSTPQMPKIEGGAGDHLGSYNDPVTGLRRSARIAEPEDTFLQHMEQQNSQFVAFEAIDYLERDPSGDLHPLLTYQAKVSKNPDHFYWHHAIRQPDAKEFIQAAVKEVEGHTKNGLWQLVHKSKVPQGTLIAPGVWSLVRKRRNIQMESAISLRRLQANKRRELLGNLFSSYSMARHTISPYPCPHQQVAFSTNRLRNGIHPSSTGNRYVYADSERVHRGFNRRSRLRPQDNEESVRPETGWLSVEQTPRC